MRNVQLASAPSRSVKSPYRRRTRPPATPPFSPPAAVARCVASVEWMARPLASLGGRTYTPPAKSVSDESEPFEKLALRVFVLISSGWSAARAAELASSKASVARMCPFMAGLPGDDSGQSKCGTFGSRSIHDFTESSIVVRPRTCRSRWGACTMMSGDDSPSRSPPIGTIDDTRTVNTKDQPHESLAEVNPALLFDGRDDAPGRGGRGLGRRSTRLGGQGSECPLHATQAGTG